MVVASYYVLFAAMAGAMPTLAVEVLAACAFVGLAVAGFRSTLWLVVVALAGHGIFDLVQPRLYANPGVPDWWPSFCAAFDVVAAAVLGGLLASGRIRAGREVPQAGRVICRIWHGRTPRAKADAYAAFLRERAIPDYRSVAGNLDVRILRQDDGEVTHFLTVTTWVSEEAIRAFAGSEILKAKYYPEDESFLLEFEPEVRHYVVCARGGGDPTVSRTPIVAS